MAPPRKDTHLSESERTHKRKQAHCIIERKRRNREKECIAKLKDLVPASANQVNLHQLTILENAVEYLEFLKTHRVEYPMSPVSDFDTRSDSSNDRKPMDIHNLLC